MTRAFRAGPIPGESLDNILEAARRAPSAGFTQGVDWLVLSSQPDVDRFFEAATEESFRSDPGPMAVLLHAGAALVPVADPEAYVRRYAEPDKAASPLAGHEAAAWDVAYWTVDAAFAVMSVLLAAEDEGLGALFFWLHRGPEPLVNAFGIPPGREVIGAVAIGLLPEGPRRPSGSPTRRQRRPFDDQVHFDRW